jgi:hypothetical protein
MRAEGRSADMRGGRTCDGVSMYVVMEEGMREEVEGGTVRGKGGEKDLVGEGHGGERNATHHSWNASTSLKMSGSIKLSSDHSSARLFYGW